MTPGPRTHRSASLRIAEPLGLPEDMRADVLEVVSLLSADRGKGHAKALMFQVCTEADRAWKTLFIHVEPDISGLTFDQLTKFYSGLGFVEIQKEPLLMARSPQRPRIARAA